uniref:Retrotransposon gag domain-containing protein n=1 Tax=Panagrolaimus davidi TaxID=227884 RepID=A0A914PG27_9BILA
MSTPTFTAMDKVALLKSLPRYSGKTGESFPDFCSSFIMKLKTLGIGYVDAVDLFPACLDGYAMERYLTLTIPKIGTEADAAKTAWNTLLESMAKALAKPYQNEIAQEQLNARRRRENEDLDSYMKDIERLAALAYSPAKNYSSAQRKAEVVRHFIRGLNMPLKEHMKRLKEDDPEKLLQEAHLEEEMQKQLARERLGEAISINLIRDATTNDTSRNNFQNESQQRNMDNRPRNNFNTFNRNQNLDQRQNGRTFMGRQQTFEQRPNNNFNNFNRQRNYNNGFIPNNNNYNRNFNQRPNFNQNFNPRPNFNNYNNPRPNFNNHQRSNFNNQNRFNNNQRMMNSRNGQTNNRPNSTGRNNGGGYRINMIGASRSPSPAYYLTIVALMTLFLPTFGNQNFQLCLKTATSTMVEMPRHMDCKTPSTDNVKIVKVELFVKRRAPVLTNATRCAGERLTRCVKAYVYSFPKINDYPKTLEISEKQCKELMKQERNGVNKKRIPQPTVPFLGVNCEFKDNFSLKEGKVALSPDGKLISDLDDMQGCEEGKGSCEKARATIIWNKFDKSQECPYVSAGIYDGIISWETAGGRNSSYLILEKLQAAFLFSSEKIEDKVKECIPGEIHKMKNDAIIKFIGQETQQTKFKREVIRQNTRVNETERAASQKNQSQANVSQKPNNVSPPVQNITSTPSTIKGETSTVKTPKKVNEPGQQQQTNNDTANEAEKARREEQQKEKNRWELEQKQKEENERIEKERKRLEEANKQLREKLEREQKRINTEKLEFEKVKRNREELEKQYKAELQRQEETRNKMSNISPEADERQQNKNPINPENEKGSEEENLEGETASMKKGLEQIRQVFKDTDPKQRDRRVYDGADGRKLTAQEEAEFKKRMEMEENATKKATVIKKENLSVTAELTSADDKINTKIQYLEVEERKVNLHNFAMLWSHICSVHNKQIDIVKILMSINPTAGTRVWLGRDDIMASFAGQVLAVKPCTTIIPEKVHWDRQINSTCYKQIPVVWNNKILFMDDGDYDLKKEGNIIKCDERRISIFKDKKGDWTSNMGKAHVLDETHDINWHPETHIIQFDAPSPYEDENLELATKAEMIWSYTKKINNIEINLNGEIPKSSDFHVDTTWVQNAMENVAGKASKMVEDIKDGAGFNWWKDLKEIIADVKVTLIILLATIGGIGLILYVYPWIAPFCGSCLKIRRRRMEQRRNRRIREEMELPINLVEIRPLERPPSYSYIPPIYQVVADGKLMYVKITVNGFKCMGLVDSGSTKEYMSEDFARHLKLNINYLYIQNFGKAINGMGKTTQRSAIFYKN